MGILYRFDSGCEDLGTSPEILDAVEKHIEKMKLGRCMTDIEIMEYLISTKS